MSLFAVGDSHSSFFEHAGLMKSHWMGPTHTATIYQLLKRDLDIYNLQEALAKSDHYVNIGVPLWKCPSGKYDTPNIKENDTVIFCYGFNDMQKNIHKYAEATYETEISQLLNDYILRLKDYEIKYKIQCIPCSIPPNPSPKIFDAPGEHEFGISGDFQTSGTSEQRLSYNLFANRVLAGLCNTHNLKFLNLYNEITDSEGFLKKEYTADYIHLDPVNTVLIEKISKIISAELIHHI
jgi:lysophospholipase L1-like esterase